MLTLLNRRLKEIEPFRNPFGCQNEIKIPRTPYMSRKKETKNHCKILPPPQSIFDSYFNK